MKRRFLSVLALSFLVGGVLMTSACGNDNPPADNPGENPGGEEPGGDDNPSGEEPGGDDNPGGGDASNPEAYSGEGVPNSALGKDGDTYTDTLTGDTYTKKDGVWVKDEKTSYAYEGIGEPPADLGVDGDTFTNTDTGDVYTKQGGVWVLTKEGDKVQKHTVTFDLAGGMIGNDITYGPVEVVHGELLPQPPDPTVQNGTFEGWYDASGEKWNFLKDMVLTDLTLTAHYRSNADTKLVLFVDPNNGEEEYSVDTFDGDYVSTKIKTPSYQGYDFMGWFFEGTDERFSGTMRADYNNMTIVARWEKAQFAFTYQVEEDNSITITGLRNIEAVNVTIPSQINGRIVKRLSPSAFQSRIYLQTVVLPTTLEEFIPNSFLGCRALQSISFSGAEGNYTSIDGVVYNKDLTEILFVPAKNTVGTFEVPTGVTKIGSYAFYNHGSEGVTAVTFPETLKVIGDHAFYGNAFTSLSFPNSLTTIEDHAFSCLVEGYIQDIQWGTGLKTIGDYAFTGCYLKETFTVPEGVETIGAYAFANSTAIEALVLPASLKTLTPAAFNGCTGILTVSVASGNQTYVSENNIVYTKDFKTAVFCPSGYRGQKVDDKEDVIVIKDGVTEIAQCAFYMVDNCMEFRIPNTVTKIGEEAFAHCYDLPEIVIPDSVLEMGESAFAQCDSLAKVTIGKGLKKIPVYAFDSAKDLKSIDIPANIEEIDENAFWGCAFETINFAKDGNLKKIGAGAFYFYGSYDDEYGMAFGDKSSSLKEIDIPDSVEEIGDRAFAKNTNLTKVKIGKGLKTFNPEAFDETVIKDIEVSADNPYLMVENEIVYSKDKTAVYYSTEEVNSSVVIPDTVKTIGEYAFASPSVYGYNASGSYVNLSEKSVTSVKFGAAVETIGEGAFYYSDISAVELPASVRTIGTGAFYSLDNCTSIKLNEGLETIGESAFTFNDKVQELVIPNTVVEIGESAFSMCTGITKLTLGSGVKRIGNQAFRGTNIEGTITLPAALEEFGIEVFNPTNYMVEPKITDFEISGDNANFVTENGLLMDKEKTTVYAYAPGNKQTELVLPSTVKTIKKYAFQSAINLTKLTLPQGLEIIDEYAFQGMSNVSDFNIPSSVVYIGKGAFAGFRAASTVRLNCREAYAIQYFDQYFDEGCQAEIVYLTEGQTPEAGQIPAEGE